MGDRSVFIVFHRGCLFTSLICFQHVENLVLSKKHAQLSRMFLYVSHIVEL